MNGAESRRIPITAVTLIFMVGLQQQGTARIVSFLFTESAGANLALAIFAMFDLDDQAL